MVAVLIVLAFPSFEIELGRNLAQRQLAQMFQIGIGEEIFERRLHPLFRINLAIAQAGLDKN